MTEEGKDVSFTTASGKAVSFKSKGKPRAKKEVVATPVETEPPEPRVRKPRAPKEPAAEDVPAPEPVVDVPAPEPPAPVVEAPAPEPAAPEPPPEPSIPAPDEPPVSVVAAPKPKAKRKPRAQPGIGKIPPKQGVDPPPEPPPLERQDAAFPLMSPEDFGMLFGNYLQTQQASKRATKHELYRSWVGL
jgi:hypothetical protein